ncbi:MAG: hypothetical protein ACI376_07260 [Candidatus Bruticola sp.]
MRSFSYSRPLGKEVCNISTNLFRLVNAVHEYKGKQDVVDDIAPAVLADLPTSTILKNVEYFCSKTHGIDELTDDEHQKLEQELNDPDYFIKKYNPAPVDAELTAQEERWLQIALFAKAFLRLREPDKFELSVNSIADLYRSITPREIDYRSIWPKFKDHGSVFYGSLMERDNGARYLQVQSCGFPLLARNGGDRDLGGTIIMQGISARDVRLALSDACSSFLEVSDYYDPLILIPKFIVDFLCISPFNSSFGNLLVAQFLVMILLAKAGYPVYRYISYDLTSDRLGGNDAFNSAFRESISGWHVGNNDYCPFTEYCLRHLSLAFRYFFYRLLPLGGRDRKAKCIKALFYNDEVVLTKSAIHDLCYEISVPTIESVLGKLSGECGFLEKIGKGRNTAYRRCKGAVDNHDTGYDSLGEDLL